MHTKFCQEISQDNPLKVNEVIEIASDCNQCRSDYRRVERAQKEGKAQADSRG